MVEIGYLLEKQEKNRISNQSLFLMLRIQQALLGQITTKPLFTIKEFNSREQPVSRSIKRKRN